MLVQEAFGSKNLRTMSSKKPTLFACYANDLPT